MKILTAIKNYFKGLPARAREQFGALSPKNYWEIIRDSLWPEVRTVAFSTFLVFVVVLFMVLSPFLTLLEVLVPGLVVKSITSLLN